MKSTVIVILVLIGGTYLWTKPCNAQSGSGVYPCPRECECFSRKKGAVLYDVVCNLRILNSYSNFSVIQTNIPSVLYVICDPNAKADLTDYMFIDLRSFLGISFSNCKFSSVPRFTFWGMMSLRQISIDNAEALTFHDDVFAESKKITHLSVVNSDVKKAPNLCKLGGLQFINFTNNHLSSFSDIGLNCSPGTTLTQLKTVVLSSNLFQALDIKIGLVAPFIWELDIKNCHISLIDQDVFLDLPLLGWLDFTNNSLRYLPQSLFVNNENLIALSFRDNPVEHIPTDLLDRVTKLAVLDLSYMSLNDCVWDALTSLWNLKELQLGNNNLTRIDRTMMYRLIHLEYLDLSGNDINYLGENIFSRLTNLRTLLLENNQIKEVSESAFNGLVNVTKLNLQNNNISDFVNGTFSGLSSLTKLNVSLNQIRAVPNFRSLENLAILDLTNNLIKNITKHDFRGLVSLRGISLSYNQIKNISKDTFSHSSTLMRIDLSHNAIEVIETNAFQGLNSLKWLFLNENKLKDVQYIFHDIPGLIQLDLSDNEVITTLYDGLFPSSLEILSLASNNIKQIHMYAFYKCNSLKKIDLRNNGIQSLDNSALTLSPSVSTQTAIYLSGNPLNCDCKIKWLRDMVDQPPLRGNLFIGDLHELSCKSGFRIKQGSSLAKMNPHNMLCEYESKCSTMTCRCCDFDPCDCKYVCPDGCRCFHSSNFLIDHFILCTNNNMSAIPFNIPVAATELYLDNNNISTLYKNSFLGLYAVQSIYLNHSEIGFMERDSFKGTSGLHRLFLDHNQITEIRKGVFECLTNLTELHLEFNIITFIEYGVFHKLRHLQILYLHHNRLVEVPESIMFREPRPFSITLAQNPWTCGCTFLEVFYRYIVKSPAVVDRFDVECDFSTSFVLNSSTMFTKSYTVDSHQTQSVIELDIKSICPNINVSFTEYENGSQERSLLQMTKHYPYSNPCFIIIAVSLFVITLLCIVALVYRNLVQVYVFAKFGLRLRCSRSESGKLYDAFVSYSNKDNEYVEMELVPKLEAEGNDYKLCVHYRDFPTDAYAGDVILQSVEDSKITIVVLSNNFIDNEWCQYGFQTAHHNALVGRQDRLVIVVLQEINQRRLNTVLKLYHKATVIKYGDPWFWEKLLYTMPERCVKNTQSEDVTQPMIENTPDVIPLSVGTSIDDEGYETPVSRSGSRQDNEKFSSLESLSLHGVNNIYEEIGPGSGRPFDV